MFLIAAAALPTNNAPMQSITAMRGPVPNPLAFFIKLTHLMQKLTRSIRTLTAQHKRTLLLLCLTV